MTLWLSADKQTRGPRPEPTPTPFDGEAKPLTSDPDEIRRRLSDLKDRNRRRRTGGAQDGD